MSTVGFTVTVMIRGAVTKAALFLAGGPCLGGRPDDVAMDPMVGDPRNLTLPRPDSGVQGLMFFRVRDQAGPVKHILGFLGVIAPSHGPGCGVREFSLLPRRS